MGDLWRVLGSPWGVLGGIWEVPRGRLEVARGPWEGPRGFWMPSEGVDPTNMPLFAMNSQGLRTARGTNKTLQKLAWEALEEVLEGAWAILGAPWCSLGAPWGVSGAPKGSSRWSLGCLVGVPWDPWGMLGGP